MADFRRKFSVFYDKHIDEVYRFVFLKVGSREVAEDITSHVFAKGWDRFRTSSDPSGKGTSNKIRNFRAYLYQIARAEVANHYRDKSKFRTISTDDVRIAASLPTMEENQQLQSDLIDVMRCLAQLREAYQNVIIWRYLDGLSIKEIAQIVDRPRGTVRVMIHRALKELRGRLDKGQGRKE